MESLVQVVNKHSDFYYRMFEDIKFIHKLYQYYNEIWTNKYELYKSKLERLEKFRDYYLIKCWKCEQTDVYNTFLVAITNCKIKMNKYCQISGVRYKRISKPHINTQV